MPGGVAQQSGLNAAAGSFFNPSTEAVQQKPWHKLCDYPTIIFPLYFNLNSTCLPIVSLEK
jgi:hypothetical protein